jgi:flagellar biosynthetic protein FliR
VEFLSIPEQALNNLNVLWTYFLLVVRFTALMALFPGIGGGPRGLAIRMPTIMVLSAAACVGGVNAEVPSNWALLLAQLVSELTLGLTLVLIPVLIVSGVQLAGNLASTSMGLQPSQLIDPTTLVPLPDISRIWSDLAIILFLMMSGHHVLIYAASGLGGELVPGTFVIGAGSWEALKAQTGLMWHLGVTVAAPVVVALLLTNFVMGLISKAVPTVNIFIVSFPLLIGIGLALSVLALPELLVVIDQRVRGMEGVLLSVVEDAELRAPSS